MGAPLVPTGPRFEEIPAITIAAAIKAFRISSYAYFFGNSRHLNNEPLTRQRLFDRD